MPRMSDNFLNSMDFNDMEMTYREFLNAITEDAAQHPDFTTTCKPDSFAHIPTPGFGNEMYYHQYPKDRALENSPSSAAKKDETINQ